MAFESIDVELKLDTKNFTSGLATASSRADKFGSKLQGIGGKMQGVGKTMTAGITAPVVGGFGLAIKSAVGWEDKLVEIAKVSDEEIAGNMGDAIFEMTDRLPIAAGGLADIAAAGARLGVPAEELEGFTETVGTFAAVTEVSAEEAADSFARISTLMELPIEDADKLGSAINELANNFGTTGSEITDVMTRAGGSFNLLGLGAEEALGLSAAMNEVSPSSRLAAGGLKRMSDALMDPGNVEAFAEALGVTPDEFIRMRDEDPQGTLLSVAEAAAEGGDKFNVLDGALGNTAGEFATLGTNTDAAREATSQANDQYENATSLQEELDNVTNSTSGQIQLMKNQLYELGVTIGQLFIPYLQDANAMLVKVIGKFQEMNPATQRLIVILALIAAAIGPVLLILGTMLVALGAIIPVVAGFGAALAGLMSVAGLAAGVMTVLGGAIAILTSPITLIIAAIALLAYAFYTDFGGIRTFTIGVIMSLADLFVGTLIPLFWQVAGTVSSFVMTFIGLLQQLWAFIEPYVMQLVLLWRINMGIITDELRITIQAWIDTFMFLFEIIEPIIQAGLEAIQLWWSEHGDRVMEIVNMLFGWLVTFIGSMMSIGVDITRAMLALMRLDFDAFSTAVMGIVDTFVDLVVGAFLWLKNRLVGGSIVPDMLNRILSVMQSVLGKVLSFVLSFLQNMLNFYVSIFKRIVTTVSSALSRVVSVMRSGMSIAQSVVQSALNRVWNIVTSVFNRVVAIISSTMSRAVTALRNAMSNMQSAASSALNRIRTIIRNGIQSALRIIQNMRKKFYNAGYNLMVSLINGINNRIGRLREKVQQAANLARRVWPGSDAKEGPLSDLSSVGPAFVDTIASGIDSNADQIQESVAGALPSMDQPESFAASATPGPTPRQVAGANASATSGREQNDPLLAELRAIRQQLGSPVEIVSGKLKLEDGTFVEIIDGKIKRAFEERDRHVDRL